MNIEKLPKYLKNITIAAVDYGTQHTGLALYKIGNDPFPMPYGRLAYVSDEELCNQIIHFAQEEFVEYLVIGVPYFTDGKSSKMTQVVLDFIKLLESKTKIPIAQQDETLSSFEAKERMQSSPRYNFKIDMNQIDALAATIILEDYLKSSQES